MIGGKFLSELDLNSFYFDITITDETNLKDEKAQYIREAFAGFEKILGKLHDKSYIYVQDVRAASYGYAGLTQEYRYQAAQRKDWQDEINVSGIINCSAESA